MPEQAAYSQGGTGIINATERATLLDRLEGSRDRFLEAVRGLSPKQTAFRAEAGRWSILDCAEHLAIFEDAFRTMVQEQLLRSPAAPEKAAGVRQMDGMLTPALQNRSQRTTTAPPLEPNGRFGDLERTVARFQESRKQTLDYVRRTDDPLRVHVAPAPFGDLDGYQWLLVIAAHTERHSAQIDEVKQSPGYPK